jgi:hypothetical protein
MAFVALGGQAQFLVDYFHAHHEVEIQASGELTEKFSFSIDTDQMIGVHLTAKCQGNSLRPN